MDDLIKRSDALAAFPTMPGGVINMASVRIRLERIPIVKVVRCVHCRFRDADGHCSIVCGHVTDDFFCACGTRSVVE